MLRKTSHVCRFALLIAGAPADAAVATLDRLARPHRGRANRSDRRTLASLQRQLDRTRESAS